MISDMTLPAIHMLPKIRLGDYDSLPNTPGIYLAIDGGKRPWYVGKSESSLRRRHATHERLKDFENVGVSHLAFWIISDPLLLCELEREAILLYQPPLNKNLKNEAVPLPYVDIPGSVEDWMSQYLEKKKLIQTLKSEVELLSPNILSYLEEKGGKFRTTIAGDPITAFVVHRPNSDFSDEVRILNEKLKNLREFEKEQGIAEITNYTIYPVLRNLSKRQTDSQD